MHALGLHAVTNPLLKILWLGLTIQWPCRNFFLYERKINGVRRTPRRTRHMRRTLADYCALSKSKRSGHCTRNTFLFFIETKCSEDYLVVSNEYGINAID
jgi:hypothetical protein